MLLLMLALAARADDPAPLGPVGTALSGRQAVMESCYRMAREDDPGLEANLRLRLLVSAEGGAQRIAVESGGYEEGDWRSCVMGAAGRARLPATAGGFEITTDLIFHAGESQVDHEPGAVVIGYQTAGLTKDGQPAEEKGMFGGVAPKPAEEATKPAEEPPKQGG